MSGLNGRVRALERENQRAAGCPSCGGKLIYALDAADDWPSWLDASSCCRRCGSGVKVIARELWEKVERAGLMCDG